MTIDPYASDEAAAGAAVTQETADLKAEEADDATKTASLASEGAVVTADTATIASDTSQIAKLTAELNALQPPSSGASPLHGAMGRMGPGSFNSTADRQAAAGYVIVAHPNPSTGTINLGDLFPNGPVAPGTVPVMATNNPIDQALAEITAWNAVAGNTPQRLKLRVSAGVKCPTWMNAIGGTVQLLDPTGDSDHGALQTLPCFWTKAFQNIYYAMMAVVAAKYDGNPLLAEVVLTPNMTFYPEPCMRGTGSIQGSTATNPNVANLLAAGYRAGDANTPYSDIWNQVQCAVLLVKMFPNTIVGHCFNPYQSVDTSGVDSSNIAVTLQLIAATKKANPACSLENDSARPGFYTGGDYGTMYAAMTAALTPPGCSIGLQTAMLANLGPTPSTANMQATLSGAAAIGASHVEMPNGYQSVLSPAQLAAAAAGLPAPTPC